VFERCARRYGDPFMLNVMLAGNLVYTADPGVVREVFKGDPKRFHAGDAYILMEPVGGPTSIFLLDEDRHLRMRRLLLPQFHGELLKRWGPVIREMTEREIERWPRGVPFPLRPSTEAITLEVIMRIVFGIREGGRAAELRRLLPRLFAVNLLQAPSFVNPKLRRDLGPRSPWGKYLRLRGRIDELLYDEIRARREMLADRGRDNEGAARAGDDRDPGADPNGGSGSPDDILTLLLSVHDDEGQALTDAELRDQLITMLMAGHETTSSALAWAFERLLRTPAVLSRLQAEVEEGGSQYMDAVIKETLRIRPVAAHVARQLQAETEIAGYRLPRRTVIAPAIYLIHRNPTIYPDPEAFRPERFLSEDPPDHYGWIPFGGGVRRCLGASLATLEMQVVISTILRSVRLRAARAAPEGIGVLGVTLVPARGAEVIAAP
jgi:cytochrome P450